MKRYFLCLLLLCSTATAEINYDLNFSYRSAPQGTNPEAGVAYDRLLWGELDKTKPLYGYARAGATLGGAPTGAVFFQLAPVAPLVFEYQKSFTYRFSESKVFDCEQSFCYGVVDRSEISAKLAAGYGKIVGLLSYLWRDVRVPASSNSVVSELEYMTLSPGTHFYSETNIAAGYLLTEDTSVGILYTEGHISEADKSLKSLYGVYRWKWNGLDLTAGGGDYRTDEPGVSSGGIVFSIGKKFGDSLSLF